jgi:hypothetical protein
MEFNPTKTVVVLGMHRSGTSMVAGMIHRLGVFMGEKLIGKSVRNPMGHYEDEEFVDLSERILLASGGSWRYPPKAEMIVEQRGHFADEIRTLVRKRNSSHALWGWKDPRTCLTGRLFLEEIVNPFLVVSLRDQQDIVRSLQTRESMTSVEAKQLIDQYMVSLSDLLTIHRHFKVLSVRYDEIVADPGKAIQSLVNFLEMDVNENKRSRAIGSVLTKERIKRMSRKVWILNLLTNPASTLKRLRWKGKNWK